MLERTVSDRVSCEDHRQTWIIPLMGVDLYKLTTFWFHYNLKLGIRKVNFQEELSTIQDCEKGLLRAADDDYPPTMR
ncbi:hypothetical protein ACTXT7_005708 [Hymenolepis weldensis]